MLSTRFARTPGNGLSHRIWSHFLFAQHFEASWWTCLRYDIFVLSWKLKNQSLKLVVKRSYLTILFCRESFQMIANGERKFLPLSLFSQLSQDLLCSFKKIALCRRTVVLAKERSGSLSQNWNKMRLSQRCPCLHKVWRGIWFWKYCHVRIRQTSEN